MLVSLSSHVFAFAIDFRRRRRRCCSGFTPATPPSSALSSKCRPTRTFAAPALAPAHAPPPTLPPPPPPAAAATLAPSDGVVGAGIAGSHIKGSIISSSLAAICSPLDVSGRPRCCNASRRNDRLGLLWIMERKDLQQLSAYAASCDSSDSLPPSSGHNCDNAISTANLTASVAQNESGSA